jgi:hypothetical protein
MNLKHLAITLHADEATDASEFQQRARVLQSLWREEQGYRCGEHQGSKGTRLLGSRLMPEDAKTLKNYLTETIRGVVEDEVCNIKASEGKLYGKPRIFNDLLSSQPLCFNLFGELTQDLALASKVIKTMTAGRFTEVTKIDFEYSPGRRDPRYLNDRSAFDVFLRCKTSTGKEGFIGIEVKYHENLQGPPGEHKQRYDDVAKQMECFGKDHEPLKKTPLQQIWRDHLLAGITRIVDNYDDGIFVTLYPKDNTHVSTALNEYRTHLTNEETFASWTLEDFVAALRLHSEAPWITAFTDRYLAFDKIDKLLESDS